MQPFNPRPSLIVDWRPWALPSILAQRTLRHDAETDAALLDRLARTGDARAFEALYVRHTEPLYATAVRITGDADVAADAVHDAWVRAVESCTRFENRSSLRTWLTGILINCLRERRRERADESLDEALTAAPPVSALQIDPLDLEAAVAALAPGFRRVLVLHDVEGFTHEEIAAMLDIVPGTSKSQLARARRQVREMLESGIPRKGP